MQNTTKQQPRIVLCVDDETYNRWNKIWKDARSKGIFSSVIGRWFVSKLSDAEEKGYKEIKKFIQ